MYLCLPNILQTEVHGNAIIRSSMNNVLWNEFTENVALMNEINDIKEAVTFKDTLHILNELFVNDELNASTVNNYNLTEWAENVMYLDSPLQVSGKICLKYFCSKIRLRLSKLLCFK